MTLIEQAIRGSVFYKGTYISILLQFLKQIFDLLTFISLQIYCIPIIYLDIIKKCKVKS